MKRAEFLARLAEGEAGPVATSRRCVNALRRHMNEDWVDESMRVAAARLAHACGEPWIQVPAAALHVGEAWLLLRAPGSRGDVVRLCAHPGGADGGDGVQRHAADALRGLRAAAAESRRFIPAEVMFQRLTVRGGAEGLDIDGRSLGLAACVAAVSRLLGRPPRNDVAGTAAVTTNGDLQPVGGLGPKLEALRARCPRVTTVVVARDQPGVPGDTGHQVLRVATLAEAIDAFGLTLDVGRPPTRQALMMRLHQVEGSEVLAHSMTGWAKLSLEAETTGRDLLAVGEEAGWDALLIAGLLASHAADPIRASALIDEVPEDGRSPRLLARKRIYKASASIDRDPEEALALAVDAVVRCRTLGPEDQRQWLGKALGTHGRVLLHRGRYEEAEPLLRSALAHHEGDPEERPRSAVYLAQCLRHGGRIEEALDVAGRAHADALACDTSEQSPTTRRHALLEISRCHLALGNVDEAVASALRVVELQPELHAYPRVGGHRTLAAAYRARGDEDAARRHLRLCVDVARRSATWITLRRVGAIAAAEELALAAGGAVPLIAPAELAAVWEECFPGQHTTNVLPLWIY